MFITIPVGLLHTRSAANVRTRSIHLVALGIDSSSRQSKLPRNCYQHGLHIYEHIFVYEAKHGKAMVFNIFLASRVLLFNLARFPPLPNP